MALKPIVGEIKAQVLNDNFSYIRQLAEEAGTDPELEQKVNNLIARIGNNEDLDTTEKSKIILAINEIYQDLASHKAETSHKHINESGTNANGSYIRFDDGTQFCWFTTEIGYLEPARLRRTWTYPASFQEVPTITLSTRVVPANVTPSEDEIGSPQIGNPSASSVNLIVWRIKGLTDFEDGDFVYGFVTAFGRWK